jgi:hypothetical protein
MTDLQMNPLGSKLGLPILSHRQNLAVLPLLLCAVLLLGSCHTVVQVLPDKPQLSAGATMRDVTFHSAALGREMPYRVFLPAQIPVGQ